MRGDASSMASRPLLLVLLTLQTAASRLLHMPGIMSNHLSSNHLSPLGPQSGALPEAVAAAEVVPAHRAPPPLDGPLAGIKRVAYLMLHKTVARGEVVYPRVAVFMIGLPGSGKSRVIKSRYLLRRSQVNSTQVLDLDAEIEQHPEWDDNDPDRVYLDHSLNAYSWADARVEARFRAAVHDQSVLRLVLDGTGTNLDRQVRRMREAAAAGMFVKAIYVRVPCQTAITRASLRRRPVTAERIRDYYSKMGSALKTARRHAHEVEILDPTFDDAPLPGRLEGIESATIVSLSS